MYIDELNNLVYESSLSSDYKDYFSDMDLTEEQKEERIAFADKFDEIMLFLFFLVEAYAVYGSVNKDFIITRIKQKYTDLVVQYIDIDDYIENYISDFSNSVVETTEENRDVSYFISLERAIYIAENEANTILNYKDFQDAIKKGYNKKAWITERDSKVRKSHISIDSKVIDIYEPFLVGNSLMLYPKDNSFGADAKEIVNCRCSIKYFKN